jgi:hypothetical protein
VGVDLRARSLLDHFFLSLQNSKFVSFGTANSLAPFPENFLRTSAYSMPTTTSSAALTPQFATHQYQLFRKKAVAEVTGPHSPSIPAALATIPSNVTHPLWLV